MVRRPPVRRPSVRPSSTMLNHLLLRHRLTNQSQILYEASLGRGNESLFAASGVTWPRWPPRPYMVKSLQKSSSSEPMDDFHKTRYVAFGTPAHHSLFKWWPWVNLDLLYSKVKFGNLGFFLGKIKTMDFLETVEACDLKVGRCRQLHVIELMKVWKVKFISWPWSQGIQYIWKLRLVFLRNYKAIFNQIRMYTFK